MPLVEDKFDRISTELEQGEAPDEVTVREFLSWFGSQRRGSSIVSQIRTMLDDRNLVTEPDFEGEFIDAPIKFQRKPTVQDSQETEGEPDVAEHIDDPTYRIGKLASANKPPLSVKPDDITQRAVTLMLTNDYSQLPVMTNDRDVKGIISWNSLGSRLALERPCNHVRDCMEEAEIIASDVSLFAAIDKIVSNQYVLVRKPDRLISGIVTTSDLSKQFQQLGEPFLLIGEIENYVRRMLRDRFSQAEVQAAKNPGDEARVIHGPADLTFGEYRRLLENSDNWEKLTLKINRVDFIAKLDEVRRIRNDVMHFDPDGIPPSDLTVLRDFVQFLQKLAELRAI